MYPVLDLDPEVLRERTLDALLNGLESLARRQPLFILVEDVHWADPTTLVLLNSMVEQIRSWPALLMVTFRPEFDPPWAGEAHVSLLSLNRLDRGQCESMISMLTGGKAVPQEIVEQIAHKTDGVPLFVEELTRTILESDLLIEEQGRYVLSGSMQPFAIPTTLQDSLMARLDQLDDAKVLAQIGAAIGREFSQALLAAAGGFEPDAITPALDRLVGSGLVFRRGSGVRAYYVFKHALVRDAAYNSMLKSRRNTLHGDIAEALLQHFPDVVRGQPELLAQHYKAAVLDDKALPYWRTAGQRAMERSAHEESISHFREGLECLIRNETDQAAAAQTVEFKTSIAECLRVIDLIDEAFSTLQEAEDIAAKFGLTRHLAQIHHQRGNLYFPLAKTEECLAEHQRGLAYVQAAGSVEEEVRSLGGLGDAYYVHDDEATALLDEAEPAARKYSPRFTLVRVLGGIALISKDPGLRQRVLAEAECLLDAGSVSHNYFAFYVDATESAFEHGRWDRMEYYADRMEAYAHAEPLPWSDFVSARARALAAFGRGDRSSGLLKQLRQLRELANAAGLASPTAQLDAALSSDSI